MKNGKRVLVVDDSATMRMFYRHILGEAGFEVHEAANGLEGLERALIGAFDLLIVDINMPKLDGYSMIRRAREEPPLQAVPVITVSSEAEEEDALKAYEAGANFYLTKPVAPEKLTKVAAMLTASVS